MEKVTKQERPWSVPICCECNESGEVLAQFIPEMHIVMFQCAKCGEAIRKIVDVERITEAKHCTKCGRMIIDEHGALVRECMDLEPFAFCLECYEAANTSLEMCGSVGE